MKISRVLKLKLKIFQKIWLIRLTNIISRWLNSSLKLMKLLWTSTLWKKNLQFLKWRRLLERLVSLVKQFLYSAVQLIEIRVFRRCLTVFLNTCQHQLIFLLLRVTFQVMKKLLLKDILLIQNHSQHLHSRLWTTHSLVSLHSSEFTLVFSNLVLMYTTL